MASTGAAAALRRGLLFLLALALLLATAAEAQRFIGLCGVSPYGFPVGRRNCAGIRCFRYDPVCGVNGVTYGCGCPEARCYGVPVVKLGEC